MTISKKLSETEVMFSKNIASCYLSVLKTEGLRGLLYLVTERYHVDKMYDEYAGFANAFSDAEPILRCHTERYVKVALDFVLARVAYYVNSEYYVALDDIRDSDFRPLSLKDDDGRYHKFSSIDVSEI